MATATLGDLAATLHRLLIQHGPTALPVLHDRVGAHTHIARECIGMALVILQRRHHVRHQHGVWTAVPSDTP